jgi:transcriptional regulator with XRE-family HTH domain
MPRYKTGGCRLSHFLYVIDKTAQDCANGTGVRKNTISQYISGKRGMSLMIAVSIVEWLNKYLDVPITERDLYELIPLEDGGSKK